MNSHLSASKWSGWSPGAGDSISNSQRSFLEPGAEKAGEARHVTRTDVDAHLKSEHICT